MEHNAQDDQQGQGNADAPMQVEMDHQTTDQLPEPEIPVRRTTRDRRLSPRYHTNEYVLLTDEGEPQFYEEEVEDENRAHWVGAMEDEMQSLYDNHTFELVKLPKCKPREN